MDWSAIQQVMRLTTKVGMVAVAERGDGDGGRKTRVSVRVCVQMKCYTLEMIFVHLIISLATSGYLSFS